MLVLDEELEFVDSRTITSTELGIHILCSGWIKRLWTLEEAVFAKLTADASRIYFQMLDGPLPYPNGEAPRTASYTQRDAARQLLMDTRVVNKMNKKIPSLVMLRGGQGAAENANTRNMDLMGCILKACRSRDTSKREDFPVCIGSLLGLDLGAILGRDTSEGRMIQLCIELRELPAAMLGMGFGGDGIGWIETKPFRWAPHEIPGQTSARLKRRTAAQDPPGIGDAEGLHMRGFRAFVFGQIPPPNGRMDDLFVWIGECRRCRSS